MAKKQTPGKSEKQSAKATEKSAAARMEELMPKSQQGGNQALGFDQEAVEAMLKEAEAAAQKAPAPGQETATISSILGEIAWMMAMSPAHRYFFLADMEWLVMTPVVLNQFRIYRDDSGKPAGLVLWASVSEEVEERLKTGATRLAPQDWKSGDRLWVVDVVDLAGGQAGNMLADMKQAVFQGKSFKFHNTGADGARSVMEG